MDYAEPDQKISDLFCERCCLLVKLGITEKAQYSSRFKDTACVIIISPLDWTPKKKDNKKRTVLLILKSSSGVLQIDRVK